MVWTGRAVAVAAALAASADGQADELRFQAVVRGGVVATGNTLGLSKATGANAPGTQDSIGAFIAAGADSRDGSYPPGTTGEWRRNASDAVLALPAGSEVLHAELVWGGSYERRRI